MRQRRVAGAQDAIAAKLDAELLAERLPDVDFGDDAEALQFQGLCGQPDASSKSTGRILLK